MDRKELSELLPVSQAEVGRQRRYETARAALEEPRQALCEQMVEVIDSLSDLFMDLPIDGYGKTHAITISKVPEQPATEEEPEKPAGTVEVTIDPYNLNGNLRWSHYLNEGRRLPLLRENRGFNIDYTFQAATDSKRASIKEETTYWVNDAVNPRPYTLLHDTGGVAKLPDSRCNEENEKNLSIYGEEYLPARTKQVEELLQSIALIKEVLEDPELNSWYQEHKAEIQREKEAEEERARIQAEEVARNREQVAAPVGAVATSRGRLPGFRRRP